MKAGEGANSTENFLEFFLKLFFLVLVARQSAAPGASAATASLSKPASTRRCKEEMRERLALRVLKRKGIRALSSACVCSRVGCSGSHKAAAGVSLSARRVRWQWAAWQPFGTLRQSSALTLRCCIAARSARPSCASCRVSLPSAVAPCCCAVAYHCHAQV